MGGLFLGSAWAGCWWAQTPAVHIGVDSVSSRFSVAQSLRGRSAPGGKLVFGVTESWGGGSGSLLPAGSPCLKRVEIGATNGC